MLNSEDKNLEVKEEEMTKPKKKRKTHRKKTTRKKQPKRRTSKGGFWDEVEKFLGVKRTRKRKKK